MALGHRIADRYPRTPAGWSVVDRREVGPFTTHVTYRRPDGSTGEWSSRFQRKHASRLSRSGPGKSALWAPSSAAWWIGVLFAIGSACFMLGPLPGFAGLVGSAADGIVFFVGSIFFTSAALLQYLEAANADPEPDGRRTGRMRLLTFEPRRIDWWATVVQLVGTLYFNASTFHALQTSLDTAATDRLVWRPDTVGSICFLVSGVLAYSEVGGTLIRRLPRTREWRIAAINLVGCVLFGISAIASFVVPSTGDVLDLAASNVATSLGALCFLIGALLLLPESASDD